MVDYAGQFEQRVADALASHADPERARAMAAYMKNQFPFAGLSKPTLTAALREIVGDLGRPSCEELIQVAETCWAHEEREWQYAGCWMLRRCTRRVGEPALLGVVAELIVTRSWWDTVDDLAAVVGDLVQAHPELGDEVQSWVEADDRWLVRASILHQLRYGEATDAERLHRACARQATNPEFFVRKAVGWALRQHSRTDPAGVVAFVAAHPELSPLSRREALRLMVADGDPTAVRLDDERAQRTRRGPPRSAEPGVG